MIAMLAQGAVSPTVNWWQLSPIITLVVGALLLLVVGAFTPTWKGGMYAWVTALTAVVTGGLACASWYRLDHPDATWGNIVKISDGTSETFMNGALAYDKLSLFLIVTFCIAVSLVALVTNDALRFQSPEPYALFLVATAGAVVMAAANDLIVLFLGLETLSLALYVLAASDRRRRRSQEAGFKYFILGGFASAVLLYGIALVYGAAQTTNIGEILRHFGETVPVGGSSAFMLAGMGLMIVGLGFKVAAVPFHFWEPDVYEGSPSNVTGFMASVAKAAAFAALLRVLVIGLPFERDDWRPVIAVLAVLSLIVGGVLAVVQTNVKRMLAYSSINHAGFMLVALVAAGYTAGELDNVGPGMPALVTYMLLYSVLAIGSFAVVAVVSEHNGGSSSLAAFRGLGRRRPILALALSVFLLAQAGVPFTSGFIAKFGSIRAVVTEGSYALATVAMVSSVIAAYLYLRIMVSVWFHDGDEITATAGEGVADQAKRPKIPFTSGLAIGLAAVFTIAVGVYPQIVLSLAESVTTYAR